MRSHTIDVKSDFGSFVVCSLPGDYLLVINDYFCIINLQNETVFASKLVWRTTNDTCSGVAPPKKWLDYPNFWMSMGAHIHYVFIMSQNTNF